MCRSTNTRYGFMFSVAVVYRFAYTWNVREDGAYFYYPCLLAFDSVPKFRDLTELFRRNFRDFSFRRNLTETKLFLPAQAVCFLGFVWKAHTSYLVLKSPTAMMYYAMIGRKIEVSVSKCCPR